MTALGVDQLTSRDLAVRPFDVVGLGALNVDFIVESGGPVAEDYEGWASGEQIDELIEASDDDKTHVHLGGSAYNTLLMLGQSRHQQEIFRFGLIGSTTSQSIARVESSHAALLAAVGVETFIAPYDLPPGRAVSLSGPNGRAISVNPGSNLNIVRLLIDHEDQLCSKLKGVRVLHISSLLEREKSGLDEVADVVVNFVRRVRSADVSPNVIVSLDPGATWVAERDVTAIGHLFGSADLLFFNQQEFQSLTGNTVENPSAVRSLRDLCPRAAVFVLKGHERSTLVHSSGLVLSTCEQDGFVRAVDSTGAGDAFAAGLLGGILRGHSVSESSRFGMRMAAVRVSGYGDAGQRRLIGHKNFWRLRRRRLLWRVRQTVEQAESRLVRVGAAAGAVLAIAGVVVGCWAVVARLI